MSARRLALAAAAALALATQAVACGGITAPDLFVVQRSGASPHARLTLLVNEEGGVTCNGAAKRAGRKLKLSDPALIEAREIQEELKEPASEHLSLAPKAGSVFSYSVRDQDGTVRFGDNSARQPKVLRQLALFVLKASQGVCGLPE
ncbi:MAG TPA: hypothetical protein VL988_07085 [Solirubrobacteraceae bacterium]|nr:hypothetical protein [Solirubrobacteraceae bacterium]